MALNGFQGSAPNNLVELSAATLMKIKALYAFQGSLSIGYRTFRESAMRMVMD
jgi:hypothetical protein